MQLTEINKLVRLFLLGSCAALLLGLYIPGVFLRLPAAGLNKEIFAIPLGVVFLGLVTALGCVVEGFAQCTVGKLCQESLRYPWVSRFLFRRTEISRVDDWRCDFEEASRATKTFPRASMALVKQQRSLAAGLTHKYAPPEYVKYTEAHNNIFVLCSGLAVLLPFFWPPLLILWNSGRYSIWVACGSALFFVLGIHFLCSLALHNYLYVWEASFRFGCIMLWERNGSGGGASSSGSVD